MTSGRGKRIALHLVLVWAVAVGVMPVLGFGLVLGAWSGGAVEAALFLALGVPLAVGLLTAAAFPARNVVPWCDGLPRRVGWAVLVLALGTAGVLAGVAAYGEGVDLGSAGTRIVLTGLPYAVAAALFVPDRWVRSGALAVVAAAVVYGGFLGPAHARQQQEDADAARYREHPELLHLGTPPPGMEVARATVGPAAFGVDYRPARPDVPGYVGLTVRRPFTPAPRCPEPAEKDVTCAVSEDGELRSVRRFPGGGLHVTLVRHHLGAEVEVASESLDEAGLRRLLDSLHPLSDEELERLTRDGRITLGQ
ncbi:hypothetical protein ACFY9F_09825 [Streptomyces sp. NPDC012421]|uniref:hypothetical protein n=1 Tax=Streptomyces sp. NPDC012421 TaxID=3364832 RepID=UPI0036E148F1